jgi:hypothetical protein
MKTTNVVLGLCVELHGIPLSPMTEVGDGSM